MKRHFANGLAACVNFANDHSFAGAVAGAAAAGAIWTGAAAGVRFAAACFLGALGAGAAAAGGGAGALVAAAAAGLAAPGPGSGAMMLTAGVEAEVGNSALVGFPVGMVDGSAAISPAPAPAIPWAGAFHDGA